MYITLKMFTVFLIVFLVFKEANFQTTPTCTCVNKNNCTQSLAYDGVGSIDIRIVNPMDPTTVMPPPPPTTSPGVCAAGYDLCCTGPSMVGCGLRYYVPPITGIVPGPGQAKYASQPWQAVVLGTDGSFIGGGALLDQSNVVTAAHKVYNKNATFLKVRMGEWNASSTTEPYPYQESVVSAIYIYPSFNPNNLFNDVAVLRLVTPINLINSPAIDTICLPTQNVVFDNMRCLVAGWGKDAFNGSSQSVEKEIDVPVVPFSDCQNRLRSTRLGPLFVLDSSFMCAGGEAGRDACVGDGGFALGCIVGGRYFLAGLVAWGIGCATPNIPGVYVNIQTFTPWILNITNS